VSATGSLGRHVATGLGAGAGGIVVGAIATTYHSAWFPIGMVVSIGVLGLYLAAMRVVASSRMPATFAAAGVLVSVTFMAGLDSEGSVMIMGDMAGLSFLLAVTLVSLVALAWPRVTTSPNSYDGVSANGERKPRS